MDIQDAYKTHMEKHHEVIVDLNDIYGMLILFAVGVVGSTIIFFSEIILSVRKGICLF